MKLYDWHWPAGFETGHVARVRGKPRTEGRITDLEAPEHDVDEPLVQITQWDGTRLYATMAAVECRRIDYHHQRRRRPRRPRKREHA